MKVDIKITIKSLLLYESITGDTSFNMNYPDKLLYASYITTNGYIKEEVFYKLFENKNFEKEINKKLTEYKSIQDLFMPDPEEEEEEGIEEDCDIEGAKVKLKDIVPSLIKDCGLDANYVMNDMQLYEIEMYMNHKVKKEKEEMESKRFWTYLNILPHVDGKKLKSPEELIKFPWEYTKEELEKEKSRKKLEEKRHTADELREILKNNKRNI